jgi:hypothetical protein
MGSQRVVWDEWKIFVVSVVATVVLFRKWLDKQRITMMNLPHAVLPTG